MTASLPIRPPAILLVEDNPGDVRLMQEVLRASQCHHDLQVVRDGAEALAYLHRQNCYATAPTPDLIVLDLNLPKLDGRQVLCEIKSDPVLRRIPVVVLTTSDAPHDIFHAYDTHANCYITKPTDLPKLMDVVQLLVRFWLSTVSLPPR